MIDPQDQEQFEAMVPRMALLLGAGDVPAFQCLRWAIASALILERLGYRATINAGSAGFRLTSSNESINQLEFVWSTPPEQFDFWHKRDLLPEVHAWAVLPDVGEWGVIVDPTARFRASWARQAGVTFDLSEIRTLYACPMAVPDGFYYKAELNACEFVHAAAERILKRFEDCAPKSARG